jgi:RNA polymerase sigma-70 factor, ECF subfamily
MAGCCAGVSHSVQQLESPKRRWGATMTSPASDTLNACSTKPAMTSSRPAPTKDVEARDLAFAHDDSAGVLGLLREARQGDTHSIGELLQQYRNYLNVLAFSQIDKRLLPRVSPSDVVQETMLRAHKNFAQFRGGTERELLAWLRQILVNNLANFVEQHILAARRDLRREVSIDRLGASLEQSTIRLAALLPDQGKTPSMVVQRREEAVLLADRLAQLPADYREVLVLRNLQQLPFDEISQRMNRSTGATRMLWLRAIEKLRLLYEKEKQKEACFDKQLPPR